MPHFPAITHVAVTVTDLPTSSEWYRRLLDVDPVLDEDGGDFHHVVFPLNSGMLLGLHAHAATDPGDRFDERRPGLRLRRPCGTRTLDRPPGRVGHHPW